MYPSFDVNSIVCRCAQDVIQFKNLNGNVSHESSIHLNYNFETKQDMKHLSKTIQRELNILSGKKKYIHLHDLHSIENEGIRKQIWIIRTFLFYQVLLFTTKLLSNRRLFQSVLSRRTFRPEVTSELANFKMGIFGSMTPTSDIDLGIQYLGTNSGLCALSYIISTIEDVFVLFFGNSSLHYDIEVYADVFTLPDMNGEPIFYLDTSHFVKEDIQDLLPYAGASIVRNYVTAYIDIHNNDKSIVSKVVNEFTMEKYLSIQPSIVEVLSDTDWIDQGKRMVEEFMTKSYDQARAEYYKLIDHAETILTEIRQRLNHLSKPVLKQTLSEPLPKDLIKTMYKAAAHALVYRAEGYVCASTIMHVVKTLQEHPLEVQKRHNPWPRCMYPTRIAECGIGPWGYLLSMLEQQGYLFRYEIEYCHFNLNKEKCTQKRKKYMFRFLDGKKRMMHDLRCRRRSVKRRRQSRRRR